MASPGSYPKSDGWPQQAPAGQRPAQASGGIVYPGLPQAQPLPQAAYPQAYPVAQPAPGQAVPVAPAVPGQQAVPIGQPVACPQATGYAYPTGRPTAAPAAAAGVAPVAVARPMPVATGKTSPVRADDAEAEEAAEQTDKVVKNSPPWLVSMVVHMAGLIIMGLIVYIIPAKEGVQLVVEPDIFAEKLGNQLEFDSPLGKDKIEQAEEPVITPDNLPQVDDPFAVPPKVEVTPDGTSSTSDLQGPVIGLALNGRQIGSKKSLLGRYGGTALTEAAVRRGLQWLAKNQLKNGSWSLHGPYTNGVPSRDLDNPTAATAMALLAFQGAGNTHRDGEFKQNVSRGWGWLLKEQDGDGNFYHEGPFHHRYYTQGQCTIAICELYGMSKDPKYRAPAEKAVQNCLNAQSSEGGWRYAPQSDSDVSVTGWVLMALQSARMARLQVPEDNLRRVERFLDRVATEDGSRYSYQKGREPTLTMTAEALLCRQYLGWPRNDPRLVAGAEYITSQENLINYHRARNVYYWYYATQVAHHMEGEYWKRWNAVMRQVVPEQQVRSGREAGSWDPLRPTSDQWEPHGGRLYVTCLSIYLLEVYYRHLPIYAKVYTDLLQSGRVPLPEPDAAAKPSAEKPADEKPDKPAAEKSP